jgi:general secretion pathway protein G
MTKIQARRTSGFSMVELLIAVIIIGILVTIIVPVLTNRAADARLAAAKADLEALAAAESQVAIDTGYIVRLHVLDDSGAVGDGLGSDDPNDVVDSIRDEDQIALFTDQPDRIFLDAKTGVVLPNNLFIRAKADPESFGWRGPYLSIQKKLSPKNPPPATPWTYGTPLDPWGNPYFLFVGGEASSNTNPAQGGWINETQIGTGAPTSPFNYAGASVPATNFDRNTILSLGPNGLPGDGTGIAPGGLLGAGDDLARAF